MKGASRTARRAAARGSSSVPREQHVVACLVTDGDQVCLVRRSGRVTGDRHLWHCVTGFVSGPGTSPPTARSAALTELDEELGLPACAVTLEEGPVLRMESPGTVWWVHTFRAGVTDRTVRLNWENDAYRWLSFADRPRDRVAWLDEVYDALHPATAAAPAAV
jgi:hypothetical protein